MKKLIDDFLFYVPMNFEEGDVFSIPEAEMKHMKVLRLGEDNLLSVTNGQGVKCVVSIEIRKNNWQAKILSVEHFDKPKAQLTIAVAPTKKSQRMEWMTEKCTEIGVNRIIPIICDRSERRKIKTERLDLISITAMKQSKQFWKVEIDEAMPFARFVELELTGKKLIADQQAESRLEDLLTKGSEATIVVGPEGGFTKDEFESAIGTGFRSIKLSTNRLRTETATLVACQEFNGLNL